MWTVLTDFISSFFTAGESVLTSILGNTILATMVIGIPLFGIVVSKILKMAKLKGRRR